MKTLGLAAAMLVAAFVVQADEQVPWKRSDVYVTAAVDVDAQGHIQHMELTATKGTVSKELSPALRSMATNTISEWQFEPARMNGQPAAARTYVHAVFEYRPHGDDYDGRLVFVGNGPRLLNQGAPEYPAHMWRSGIEAELVLLVKIQPDGSLTDVKLDSARTTRSYPALEFVRTARHSIESWHAAPEMVDGHPVKTWVRLPIVFTIGDPSRKQQKKAALELAPDSPKPFQPMNADDQAVALDSPLKLRPESP